MFAMLLLLTVQDWSEADRITASERARELAVAWRKCVMSAAQRARPNIEPMTIAVGAMGRCKPEEDSYRVSLDDAFRGLAEPSERRRQASDLIARQRKDLTEDIIARIAIGD